MDTEKITHVLIVANWRKKESHEMSETIARYLGERGIRSTVFKTMTANEKIHIEEGTGLVICLGGDGTVLYCARYLHSYGIPIPPSIWGPSASSPRSPSMSGRRPSISYWRESMPSAVA